MKKRRIHRIPLPSDSPRGRKKKGRERKCQKRRREKPYESTEMIHNNTRMMKGIYER